MFLTIEHPEADTLARALADKTGESVAQAVVNAIRERLTREEGPPAKARIAGELLIIGKRCAALPEHDARSADEILGYDERGLPS